MLKTGFLTILTTLFFFTSISHAERNIQDSIDECGRDLATTPWTGVSSAEVGAEVCASYTPEQVACGKDLATTHWAGVSSAEVGAEICAYYTPEQVACGKDLATTFWNGISSVEIGVEICASY